MENNKKSFSPITYDIWMKGEKLIDDFMDRPPVVIHQEMLDNGIWAKKKLSPERIKRLEDEGVVFPD